MTIKDVSIVPGFGSQVVIALWEKDNEERVIEPGNKHWPRWQAVAKRLVGEVKEQQNIDIKGKFCRVDLKQFIGSLLLAKVSYKNELEDRTVNQSI